MKVKLAQAIAASNRCAIRSSQLLPLPTRRPPAADDQRTSIVSPARMLRDWRRVLRFGRPGHGIARDLDPRLAAAGSRRPGYRCCRRSTGCLQVRETALGGKGARVFFAKGLLQVRVSGFQQRFGGVQLALCCPGRARSEEHTSELQSLMRISYDVFCLKKKTKNNIT